MGWVNRTESMEQAKESIPITNPKDTSLAKVGEVEMRG